MLLPPRPYAAFGFASDALTRQRDDEVQEGADRAALRVRAELPEEEIFVGCTHAMVQALDPTLRIAFVLGANSRRRSASSSRRRTCCRGDRTVDE